jgi:hypothetical protein
MEQIYERLKESAFQVGQYKEELIGKQGRGAGVEALFKRDY